MTRTRRAPGPTRPCAARTSRVKSYQSRSCQSAAGYGIAFTCLYAATGKKAGRPNRGFPVVTASHRSSIAWRKAAEAVLGKARVCGRAPAPGATGRDTGDAVALARGAALAAGAAVCVGCDRVPAALALAVGGG